MNRMSTWICAAFLCSVLLPVSAGFTADVVLPVGSAPEALSFPHFPDRMHAFIWRNWTVVEADRLAKVLDTSVENVKAVAESMGLPRSEPVPAEQRVRGYITVLRRNWHLLPYEQLLVLLDMSAEQLAYCLREDDFLYIKLGMLKPKCPPLKYAPPSNEARKQAAEIKRIVTETVGDEMVAKAEPRFSFVEQLGKPRPAGAKKVAGKGGFSLSFIYSYFAIYGDPLMNPQLDPYPDGLLQRLSDLGVNGVWMHVVLRHLAPSKIFPEFGKDCETRLANLRQLVQRAKRYGVSIYLYMNEPRAMPADFFKDRPQMKGVQEGDHYAVCTSDPQVRQWLTDSLAYVFKNVPDLGGVFTITGSENLTSCASHYQFKNCPNCKTRTGPAIIAEVNAAVDAGVHRGNPDAKVLAWDWGWPDDWAPDIIANLPKSIWLMSVSEWSLPIERGGVKSAVGEYSISAVGPGPRATRHWKLAKQAGLKTAAKVAFNNTWELSAIPYLPTLDLIAEHASNLTSAGVDGVMLSWSLGGYPSPNLELAGQFSKQPPPSKEAALDAIARDRYGPDGAPLARKAWTAFSNAFREFPYACALYSVPQQYGPSNILYPTPTGYHATMVGIPYDDVNGWRGAYSPEGLADQFVKVADGWKEGLPMLAAAVEKVPADKADDARAELRFARTARLHFQSSANQTRFTAARNELLNKEKPLPADQRAARIETMRRIAQDEIGLARELFTLAREDSRIGYEASNHYYYVPVDLVEKIINCRYILDHVLADMK